MPQSIAAMTVFAAAMMLGAVPAFLAYPNFKIEPAKYRSGLAGSHRESQCQGGGDRRRFPEEMLACVALGRETKLIRAGDDRSTADRAIDCRRLRRISTLESLAFIQHSAGTTGLQKGVALTHAAVLRQIEHLAESCASIRRDRIYSWLPLYHDMGLIACFMLPMVCHIPVVMQSPIDWVMQPESMLQIISETQMHAGVDAEFRLSIRAPADAAKALGRLRSLVASALINCSEPVRASSMNEFQNAFSDRQGVLQSSYAMAENVFAVTQSDIDAAGPRTLWVDAHNFAVPTGSFPSRRTPPGQLSFTSSGRPLPNQQIRIAYRFRRTIARDDSVGEIAIQSDCLSRAITTVPTLPHRRLSMAGTAPAISDFS